MKRLEENYALVDKYGSTYWAGRDCNIYFNDIFIREAIQISYNVVESVRPYYNYASYEAATLHHGTRIVQGELTVNFKKHNYLYSILEATTRDNQTSVTNSFALAPPPLANISIDDARELLKTLEISPTQKRELIDRIKRGRDETTNPALDISTTKPMFSKSIDGFDIHILFGTELDGAQTLVFNSDNTASIEYATNGLNFQGSTAQVNSLRQIAPFTALKIKSASINALGQSITDDGRSIVETYTFMAKGIQLLEINNTQDTSLRT